MSATSRSKPHAQLVDEIAAQILALAESLAPIGGEYQLADAGTEALLSALIRRVGPFAYTCCLAERIPAKRA